MKARQIILDTETTGLLPNEGHRIVQIACIEMVDGIKTGKHYNIFLNPERDSHPEALKLHGLTTEFLADKPKFVEIADEFLLFIEDAELIIHNAPFDLGFLNHELQLINKPVLTNAIVDTRVIAQQMYTKELLTTELVAKKLIENETLVRELRYKTDDDQSLIAELVENTKFRVHSLDHLCQYFGINLSVREKYHGALIDCELLSQVYFYLRQEQAKRELCKTTLVAVVIGVSTSSNTVSTFYSNKIQTPDPEVSEFNSTNSLSRLY